MEPSTLTTIISLKKDLARTIEQNHYNLLSPEVIELSIQIDCLMTPLFKQQLDDKFLIDYLSLMDQK